MQRGDCRPCVQVVPHITDAIQDWIERVAHTAVDGRDGLPDVCIIELGGTVRRGACAPARRALPGSCHAAAACHAEAAAEALLSCFCAGGRHRVHALH